MRTITWMMIVALFSSTLVGCIVRTHDHHHSRRHHHSHAKKRGCPPAYHWDGRGCVHNGRGKHKGHRR
jgi:hypothetical protein